MADSRRIESAGPVAARHRREEILRRRPRELAAQLALEPRHDIREGHGTIVIAEQLPCGVG